MSEAVASYSKVNVPRYKANNIMLEVDVPTKVLLLKRSINHISTQTNTQRNTEKEWLTLEAMTRKLMIQ